MDSENVVDHRSNSIDPAVAALLRDISDLAERASVQFIPDAEKLRVFSAAFAESRTRAQAATARPIPR